MAESHQENDIREGFLCPVCHKDLRSPSNLLTHFQDLHSEEQDLLKSIRDLVGKAKKKILKVDEQDLESFKTEISLQKYYVEYSEPQLPGHSTNHTEFYKTVRRERLDHRTAETNMLIIRLDKLLRFDGVDRRQNEQGLVIWLDGETVTRCPSCAAKFNITRRQHHCRLCGSIMCNSCSCFLSYDVAKTIVTSMYSESNKFNNSSSKSDSDSLRICLHCMNMLEHRRSVQLAQAVQPTICKLYANLQKIKADLQQPLELYNKMYNALTSGDSTFQLQDAQALRGSIARQAEALDISSKQLASIPVDPECPRAVVLQNIIRHATSQYIKDHLLTLPVLPSAVEIEKVKRDRLLRKTEVASPAVYANIRKVAVTTGWSPDNMSDKKIPETLDDPLIQQINIVKNYIAQARKAQRFEEVASLEENLKLLQETRRQQLKFNSDKI